MNRNKIGLKELPINVLARLWFRCLWQKYDSGGISVGRSLRCDLLDCYLDFARLPKYVMVADDYTEGLEEEILRRPVVNPLCKVEMEKIPRYSKRRVALAGLGALLALEWSVEADVAWKDGYGLERVKIKKILERIRFIEVPKTLDVKNVSKLLLKRKGDIEYQESKKELQTTYHS